MFIRLPDVHTCARMDTYLEAVQKVLLFESSFHLFPPPATLYLCLPVETFFDNREWVKMGIHSKLNFPVVDKSAIDPFFMAEVDGKGCYCEWRAGFLGALHQQSVARWPLFLICQSVSLLISSTLVGQPVNHLPFWGWCILWISPEVLSHLLIYFDLLESSYLFCFFSVYFFFFLGCFRQDFNEFSIVFCYCYNKNFVVLWR